MNRVRKSVNLLLLFFGPFGILLTSAQLLAAAMASGGGRKVALGDDPLLTYLFEHERYNWQSFRTPLIGTGQERYHNALVMKDKRVVEYLYDEADNLKIYETIHKIIRVNSDEAIQQYSKVYIPLRDVHHIITIKARFISKTGQVSEVAEEDFKDLENPMNGGAYKIFAISGAERGGEIEYFYTLERNPKFFGRETFQSGSAAREVEFEIITPANLVFEARSYNGFPEMQLLENRYPGKNSLYVRAPQVPALLQEHFSFYAPNLMRVDYKLAYDRMEGSTRLHTWNHAAEEIVNNIYLREDLQENQLATIGQLLKKVFKGVGEGEEARIQAIDAYIKQNIRQDDDAFEHHNSVMEVLAAKYGGKTEIVRLYAIMFMFADIEHELVLTTDRTSVRFDKDFETWYALESYLFHFPKSGKYLAPNHLEYGLGLVPYHYINNAGLFISLFQPGTESQFATDVRDIPETNYADHHDRTLVSINFKDGFDRANVWQVRQFTGYPAVPLRFINNFAGKEAKDRLLKEIACQGDPGAQVASLAVRDSHEATGQQSLELLAELKTTALTEQAGDRVLLQVGALLEKNLPGPANPADRATDLEHEFGREKTYSFEIEVPAGYELHNLDALKQQAFAEENGQPTAGFVTHYEIVGDKLRIDVREFYKKAFYCKEQASDFARMLDARAQFTRAVILLKKKK
jgi:hypothetical protein